MKRIALIIISLTLITSMSAENFSAMHKGKILYFNILSSGDMTAEITFRGKDVNAFVHEYAGKIEIPESITQYGKTYTIVAIGENAFQDCSRVTDIILPSTVTEIKKQAFIGCKNLTSLDVPASVTSIATEAFSGCSILSNVKLTESIKNLNNKIFDGCSKLNNFIIPNSVKSIGENTFLACNSLSKINIPAAVSEIGLGAFDGCSSLTEISVDTLNENYASVDGILYNKNLNTLIRCPEGNIEFSIVDSTRAIGRYAFNGCNKLSSITLPDSILTDIGEYAFLGCSGLTSFVIPKSVKTLQAGAFSKCNQLEKINFIGAITAIKSETFYECSALTQIKFPNTISYIGDKAFYNCSNITAAYFPSSVKEIGKQTFYGCTKLVDIIVDSKVPAKCEASSFDSRTTYSCTVYVPEGASTAFKEAQGWRSFQNIREDAAVSKLDKLK